MKCRRTRFLTIREWYLAYPVEKDCCRLKFLLDCGNANKQNGLVISSNLKVYYNEKNM